jgi:HSP20 family protein
MDRMFSDVFGDTFGGPSDEGEGGMAPTFYLPVDIRENDDRYVVQAPIPGFRPEDVEVAFSDGVLTITATRREEREEREGRYLRREIAFGNYQRRIAMPGDVQAENIRARYDNGVLTIEVPRSSRPQPRRIEVQPGEQSRQELGDGSASSSSDASARSSSESSTDATDQSSTGATNQESSETSSRTREASTQKT